MQARLRTIPNTLGVLLLVAIVLSAYTAQQAFATHQPADKVAVSGSTFEAFYYKDQPGEPVELLREQLRVSSPSDLIIQLTAECSVDTTTVTGDDSEGGPEEDYSWDSDFAQVETWVEIDGHPVAVADDERWWNDGRIVLCERYQRQDTWESEEQENPECEEIDETVTGPGANGEVRADIDTQDPTKSSAEADFGTEDREIATIRDPGTGEQCDDGLDGLEFFQRTRQANGFNWFAVNGGTYYDDPANGQNVLDIVLYGSVTGYCEYDDYYDDEYCWANGLVGDRTMIIQPVQAANHEAVTSDGTESSKK